MQVVWTEKLDRQSCMQWGVWSWKYRQYAGSWKILLLQYCDPLEYNHSKTLRLHYVGNMISTATSSTLMSTWITCRFVLSAPYVTGNSWILGSTFFTAACPFQAFQIHLLQSTYPYTKAQSTQNQPERHARFISRMLFEPILDSVDPLSMIWGWMLKNVLVLPD